MIDAYVQKVRVGMVPKNTLLDTLTKTGSGAQMCHKIPGRHLGLCRKHGQYFLIKSTTWIGERDRAVACNPDTALDAILMSSAMDVLPLFPDLNQLLETRLCHSLEVFKTAS